MWWQTKNSQIAFATTLFLTVVAIHHTTAANLKVADTINSVCDEAASSISLSTTFLHKIDTATQQAKNLQKSALKWRLAAAADTNKDQAKAKLALALLLRQRAMRTQAAISAASGDLQAAAAVLQARAAALLTAHKLQPKAAPTKVSAANEDASNNFGTTGAKCTIQMTQTVAAGTCTLDKIADQSIGEEETPSPAKASIKATPDAYFIPQKLTVAALAAGTAGTNSNLNNADPATKDCYNGGSGRSDRTHALGADVTYTPTSSHTISAVAIGTAEDSKLNCGAQPDLEARSSGSLAAVKWAVCAGLTTKVDSEPDITAKTGSDLMQQADILPIAEQLLFSKDELGAIPSDQRTQKIKDKTQEVYGKGPNDFTTNYLEALTTKLSYNLGKQNVNEDINTIVKKTEAEVILSHFEGINYNQKQDKSTEKESSDKAPNKEETAKKSDKGDDKKDGDNKAATANCTSHSTQDACTKEQNCKWENNACKDSSILVTKKFALSVVSAAFVALLF
ncbi:Trypanosome variant surface glycoprotein C-terminal domain containing protein [Trypanosoma brucei equiperdum]|uniref:Trypanosome variant surface glycoprotein C-terminal domain containing protein n=1 Tax=Trypanosoma brucei equiperdum TaxID=630700 RepID=A0A3L6L801_9TRYP|nr:Trypanosome variant surface glycoprotein C-terminal domain containing protein [Trypanosoma brucei equiperdum]RHW70464.1 Trypanosome variant surface glycoprotein C-terminal domain containing protein [Trypanosoma brucei equiperdum]RHW70530.1 Trypanosome variant surface glycoprotein C-terminal domain containing protein [Trypanosoma brucei equiperdum]RHW70618.1 Trypanosome variant surface glycoprotein C-terminal domain containing protein [Trypanosoma brucei equiperdum]